MFYRNFMFCSPKSDSSQDSEGESGDSRVLSQAEMAYIAIQVDGGGGDGDDDGDCEIAQIAILVQPQYYDDREVTTTITTMTTMMAVSSTCFTRWRRGWSTSRPTTTCTGTWLPETPW